jgi:hypothetical protein
MWEWYEQHEELAWWMFALSVATFLGGMIVVPILLARMPSDYFLHPRRIAAPFSQHHPALRISVLIIKNLLGVLFVLFSIPQLAGPGQGVLTLLIGVSLLDVPGKRRLELWLVRLPRVLRAINWVRRKADRPPLELPERGPEKASERRSREPT